MAAAVSTLISTSVLADDRESVEQLRQTTMAIIDALVEKGILTREAANQMIANATKKAAGAAALATPAPAVKPGDPVRVTYVPETVREQIKEQLRDEIVAQARTERWAEPNAVPEWVDRIRVEGDLRVRYEQQRFNKNNSPVAAPDINSINAKGTFDPTSSNQFLYAYNGLPAEDNDLLRVRARLGVSARAGDSMSGAIRMVTGNTTNVVSTSQTLGMTSGKYSFALDQAFVRWTPADWATIWGGRMPNPWLTTDLIWAPDLAFDGVAGSLQLTDVDKYPFRPFLTAGAFPIQNVAQSPSESKWLYAGQTGFNWDITPTVRTQFAVARFQYHNLAGRPNAVPDVFDTDWSAPQYVQKGNTLFNIRNSTNPNAALFALASDYRLLNIAGGVDFAWWDPVHVQLYAGYVKNTGFDRAAVSARVGADVEPRTKGYNMQLTVGMPTLSGWGDWQLYAGYRYLERDAVLDAFTDPDFHLGGTNTKGYLVGGSWGFDRNAYINLRWMSADEIDNQIVGGLVGIGGKLAIDVLQADVNFRF